jgi:hypothetical protein
MKFEDVNLMTQKTYRFRELASVMSFASQVETSEKFFHFQNNLFHLTMMTIIIKYQLREKFEIITSFK